MSTENIDWSKAPKDAEFARPWGDEGGPNGVDFYKADGAEGLLYLVGSGWAVAATEQDDPHLVRRPAWVGNSLPPVGTVCEMLSHGEEESEWIDVQILAHTKINGEDHAVFQYEEHVGTGSLQGSCFRPVRTAQERGVDLVLSEIEALYAEGGPAAIYDAGYRKIDPAGAQP